MGVKPERLLARRVRFDMPRLWRYLPCGRSFTASPCLVRGERRATQCDVGCRSGKVGSKNGGVVSLLTCTVVHQRWRDNRSGADRLSSHVLGWMPALSSSLHVAILTQPFAVFLEEERAFRYNIVERLRLVHSLRHWQNVWSF